MFKYILEIKNRIILLFITWFSVICVSYLYKETLLFLFIESELFTNNEFKVYYFIFTDVIEVFSVYIELIFFVSLQIWIIYLMYHMFIFLSYGLFIVEYYYLNYMVKTVLVIWFFSIIISKYFLIPSMWNFFINFQNGTYLNLYFEAKLNEYLNFYMKFYYIFIFYCQIFSVLLFFFKYTNANCSFIKKFRKLCYYFLVIISTLISPPEILSQIVISLFLICCYELFIFLFLFKFSVNLLIRKPIKTNKNSTNKQQIAKS